MGFLLMITVWSFYDVCLFFRSIFCTAEFFPVLPRITDVIYLPIESELTILRYRTKY
jgi:hypothetical protein